MVGRLLERYVLSKDEIDIREERCVQLEVPIGGQRRRPIDDCVTSIARFCDCKVWISRDNAVPSYVFFGFDADTTLAGYLFSVIDRAIRTELGVFRRMYPRRAGVRRPMTYPTASSTDTIVSSACWRHLGRWRPAYLQSWTC
jgi:hypothetical protein